MSHPVVYFEAIGPDGKALQQFYSEAFGWKIDANNPMQYGTVDAGGEGINGGISGGDGSARLTFYVQANDLQAALNSVEKFGGRTIMPVTEVTEGTTIAMFADPAGNVVGLVKGD